MVEVISHLESRISRLIEEIDARRVKVNQLEKENDGLKISLADYHQIETALAASRAYARELEVQNAELTALREQLALATAKAAAVEAEKQILVVERESAIAESATRRERVVQLEALCARGQASLDTARAEIEAAKARNAEYEGRESAGETLRVELTAAQAALAATAAEVSILKAKAEPLEREVADCRANEELLQMLEDENQELKKKLNESADREAGMRNRLTGLITRIEKAENELDLVVMAHETV